MNDPQLCNLLDDLDSAPLAGDGMSRLVVTRLAEKRIPYQAMLGKLKLDGKVIYPHFWVEANGCVIDFRARPQLGDDARAPHGVVPREQLEAQYEGQEIVIDPLPEYLFKLIKH